MGRRSSGGMRGDDICRLYKRLWTRSVARMKKTFGRDESGQGFSPEGPDRHSEHAAPASFDDGMLTVPDFALLMITGGAPAARDALATRLAETGAAIADDGGDAERLLKERRLTALDIGAPDKAREAGHGAREAGFSAAKHAHAAAIALEPDAHADRVESLAHSGFAAAFSLPATPPDRIVLAPLSVDHRSERGPFDIIGDVHGCISELRRLLAALGYMVAADGADAAHPDGRRAVFVGDLCDRGPENAAVLRLVMNMVDSGAAFCVVGNHDDRLRRRLHGRHVSLSHGLAETVDELDRETARFRDRVRTFLDGLPSHLWLDDGRLIVAHAGLKEAMHGRDAKAVRSFAMYGETTGERDAYGLPIRLDWARNYQGSARVVHGHTPMTAPGWSNAALCIDSGCVFGGVLTAYRWPEETLIGVAADRIYCAPPRPLAAPSRKAALTIC